MTRPVLELYTKNRRPIVRTAVWILIQRLNMAYDGETPYTQLSIAIFKIADIGPVGAGHWPAPASIVGPASVRPLQVSRILMVAIYCPLPKIVPGHREPVSLKRGDDSFNLLKALRVIQAVIV